MLAGDTLISLLGLLEIGLEDSLEKLSSLSDPLSLVSRLLVLFDHLSVHLVQLLEHVLAAIINSLVLLQTAICRQSPRAKGRIVL